MHEKASRLPKEGHDEDNLNALARATVGVLAWALDESYRMGNYPREMKPAHQKLLQANKKRRRCGTCGQKTVIVAWYREVLADVCVRCDKGRYTPISCN